MTDTWSKGNPNLQRAIDSTSLKAIQFCPRFYQLRHIEGWAESTVDLEFGRLAATGFETFWKQRVAGASKEEALVVAVGRLLEETAAPECNVCGGSGFKGGSEFRGGLTCSECGGRGVLGPAWGGEWHRMWRCKGEEPYRNARGNRAKCPFSHAGKWFPPEAPEECGACGSATEEEWQYVPGHKTKHRVSLIRMMVWYADEQPEDLDDGLRPYVFPDGTPAIELSVRLTLPWKTPSGEPYILAGHIDYIGQFGSEMWPVDAKTTTKSLTEDYFTKYAPDTQFDTYDLMVNLLYPDLQSKGVMVDAAQTLVSGVQFARHRYYKTEEHREEHWKDLEHWIREIERFAEQGHWPMNKRNCWICPFRRVCALKPSQRERALKSEFKKVPRWDPLEER